jgi:transposase
MVRAADEIVGLLDLWGVEAQYAGGGRPAYPPRLLCAVLFFAYSQGIRSSREIARRLEYDLRFIWLAQGLRIDHRTLSRFRQQFAGQLQSLFGQTVRLGLKAQLLKLEGVAFDGTKIAANASRRMLTDEQLQAALAAVDERIAKALAEAAQVDAAEDAQLGEARGDEVAEELHSAQRRRERLQQAQEALAHSDQRQVSLSDAEAPKQKIGAEKRPGYNGQVGVDKDSGMIVAADVTDAQNDTEQLAVMTQQALEHAQATPETIVADCGYHSGGTLEAMAALEVPEGEELTYYIAQQRPSDTGRYGHEAFEYDAQRDVYVCPGGQQLEFKGLRTLRRTEHRVYRSSARSCGACCHRDRCLSPKGRRRELLISAHAELRREMLERLQTEAAQEALRWRRETVEPTFGVLKSVLGLRQFLLRGLRGARIEFVLCAIGVNLRKLAACWPTVAAALSA